VFRWVAKMFDGVVGDHLNPASVISSNKPAPSLDLITRETLNVASVKGIAFSLNNHFY